MGPVTRCADVATGHGVLTLFLDFLARLASASPPSPCISPRSRSFRLLGGNSQRWDVVRTRSSAGLEGGLSTADPQADLSRSLFLLAPLHLPCFRP
mgnify:CR=1 FL=1|jgi:hypothetical protein